MARPHPALSRRHRRTALLAGVVLVAGGGLLGAAPGVAAAPSYQPSTHSPQVRYVSSRMPIDGPSVALGVTRPAAVGADEQAPFTSPGQSANTWTKVAILPSAVVHDVDFPTAKIGYAAAELGQVWKTTDGGATWTEVLNRGFPYYYYGVAALSAKKLVVSGFNDQTSQGIISWSYDGGATWSADEVLSPNAWVGRIRLPKGPRHGLAMNGGGSPGSNPNDAWWSSQTDQWNQTVPDPNGGWFGNQFTLLKNRDAYASGITFCRSTSGGASWTCQPPADSVFDGPTEFLNDQHGWTGGGEISPNVEGWLHRTTDNGNTWSGRVLETAWPIRQIEFLSPKVGWAAGGNIYSNVGGIYYTSDGGKTWVQDADTGDEVGACAHHTVDGGANTTIWCVGDEFNGSAFLSNVYETTVATPQG